MISFPSTLQLSDLMLVRGSAEEKGLKAFNHGDTVTQRNTVLNLMILSPVLTPLDKTSITVICHLSPGN
jgi:hypothetical protein